VDSLAIPDPTACAAIEGAATRSAIAPARVARASRPAPDASFRAEPAPKTRFQGSDPNFRAMLVSGSEERPLSPKSVEAFLPSM